MAISPFCEIAAFRHLRFVGHILGPSAKSTWKSLSCDKIWLESIKQFVKKATKRLYFLKVLKRAVLPSNHLLHYYTAVIRFVLEYCSCTWHHNITNKLSLQIEAVQKRAIKIIFDHI